MYLFNWKGSHSRYILKHNDISLDLLCVIYAVYVYIVLFIHLPLCFAPCPLGTPATPP